MGTQKNQTVSITVSIDFPESWTEDQLSTLLVRLLRENLLVPVPASLVKKLSDIEELAKSTTPSDPKNTDVCSLCNSKGCPGAPRYKGICPFSIYSKKLSDIEGLEKSTTASPKKNTDAFRSEHKKLACPNCGPGYHTFDSMCAKGGFGL